MQKIFSIKCFIFILYFIVNNDIEAQSTKIGLMATGGQYDFFTDPILFDDSYDWTFWAVSGTSNVIFNFQKSVSEKISIRPFVGYTLNRFTLFYRPSDNSEFIHSYTSIYINYGAFVNYHFNKKMTGLQISLGPRIYSKTSQSLLRRYRDLPLFLEERIDSPSEKMNNHAFGLFLKTAYVFKIFKLFGKQLDFEIGFNLNYRPVGFFKSEVEARQKINTGLSIGVNMWLDNEEAKQEK